METWTMGTAIRARKAETPKQPSCCLRLRALHFYPDRQNDDSPLARLVDLGLLQTTSW